MLYYAISSSTLWNVFPSVIQSLIFQFSFTLVKFIFHSIFRLDVSTYYWSIFKSSTQKYKKANDFFLCSFVKKYCFEISISLYWYWNGNCSSFSFRVNYFHFAFMSFIIHEFDLNRKSYRTYDIQDKNLWHFGSTIYHFNGIYY